MLIKQLQEIHNNKLKSNINFYTPGGIHVYFKDEILNKEVDIEKVIAKIESLVPPHLFSEIEMIMVGWFKEFEERDINAFYDSGTIYISNIQDDNDDAYDDIIHELAHAIETTHGYEIYADEKVKQEFLRKREYLHDMLWKRDIKAPMSFFTDVEFNQEFDDFLYKKIGYDKLSSIMTGLFISAYAATSLREYFATGFTEYYTHSDHNFLKKVSPALYEKISNLHNFKDEDVDYS